MDAFISSISCEGPPANRPPHIEDDEFCEDDVGLSVMFNSAVTLLTL